MSTENFQCPDAFICPIMQGGGPTQDPVIAAGGHTYERSGIEQWLANNNTSPVTTGEVLRNQVLLPNHQLKSQSEQQGPEESEESCDPADAWVSRMLTNPINPSFAENMREKYCQALREACEPFDPDTVKRCHELDQVDLLILI